MGVDIHWPFQMPRKRQDFMGKYLAQGISDEEWDELNKARWVTEDGNRRRENPYEIKVRMGDKHKSSSGEHIKLQAHKEAVDQKARMAEFQAAQKGAPQSYTGEIGKPFSTSKYKSTAMFPSKSMPVSDPGRLQAAPVGYDKEEWWRQSPYVSPRQPGYSIFSMKPYSW